MEKKTELIIRSTIGFIGLISIIIAIFNIFSEASLTIANQSFQILSFNFIFSNIILIFIGYLLILAARFWRDFFKYITRTIISFALLFLIFGFFFIAINSNSNQITESIQPSIDYLIVGSIDSVLDDYVEPYEKELEVVFAINPQISEIHYSNLSDSDAKFISNSLDLDLNNDSEKEKVFAELFVVTAYNEIKNNQPEFIGVPVPVSELKSAAQSEIDLSLIYLLDSSLIKEMYVPNDDAFISLLVSQGEDSKLINPSNINDEDTIFIWKKLNLDNSVSIQTKKEFLKLILSGIALELESYSNSIVSIPIDMLGSLFPKELKPLTSYDLFANNLSVRAQELSEIRNSCENKDIEINEICDFIETTKYENMILLMQNESENMQDLPMNITPLLESISTEEKIETIIEEKTSSGPLYLSIGALLLIISLLVYYLHFKLFNRDLLKIHIPYYISKINLYHFVPTFIMVFVFYILIKGDYIINFLASSLKDMPIDVDLFTNFPIYKVMININETFFYYSLYYLIFSILVFALFYFMLKEEVKKDENNSV